jgi:hypothetical protein
MSAIGSASGGRPDAEFGSVGGDVAKSCVTGRGRVQGVDEASFLRADRHHHTIDTTGLIDLEARRVIDMVEGNAVVDRRKWTSNADPAWIKGIESALPAIPT